MKRALFPFRRPVWNVVWWMTGIPVVLLVAFPLYLMFWVVFRGMAVVVYLLIKL